MILVGSLLPINNVLKRFINVQNNFIVYCAEGKMNDSYVGNVKIKGSGS